MCVLEVSVTLPEGMRSGGCGLKSIKFKDLPCAVWFNFLFSFLGQLSRGISLAEQRLCRSYLARLWPKENLAV